MTIIATFVLICAGITGIHSVITVSHVAMEAGRTVLIPCHYEADYRDHVKYLCRGSVWKSCRYTIRSDNGNLAKYSINDDKTQRIVTFTINNLELRDSGDYWCIIEINHGVDIGNKFKLTVTAEAEPKLSVDSQWISGYYNGQVTVDFKCEGSGRKQWCRVGGTCLSGNGIMKGAQVSMENNDKRFSVTMSGLNAENIGWYWFSLDDLQMPVFLQLTERPTTKSTTAFESQTLGTPRPVCVTSSLKSALIALGLLVVIVIVSLFAWFTLKINLKKTEAESSPECSDNPVYSNVTKTPTSNQNYCSPKDNDVLYSSVTFINNQASKKAAIQEEDVVYSILGHQQ
ncbi:unnamed protein product [Knipowitschia caucasica]